MFRQMKLLTLAGALAASALVTTGAEAAGWIVGLVDGKSIVTIDPATRKVASKADIKGAGTIIGIDVRPADGMLYGVASDGSIVTIDPKTGQATPKSKLSEMLKPGVTADHRFQPGRRSAARHGFGRHQPARQRRRRQGRRWTARTSTRKATSMPARPRRSWPAPTRNSLKGTKATTLYNIDATTGALVTQAPPNDGVLNTIGSLGMAVNGPVAFNIVAPARTRTTPGWWRAARSTRSISRPARPPWPARSKACRAR